MEAPAQSKDGSQGAGMRPPTKYFKQLVHRELKFPPFEASSQPRHASMNLGNSYSRKETQTLLTKLKMRTLPRAFGNT